jgi:hypothetical protein
MLAEDICSKCKVQVDRGGLTKCPMCFKQVCDECRHQVSGRTFCSAPCAQFFFFEGEEDDT